MEVPMSPRFEIGVVYKKSARYYLAVTEASLITYREGQLQEVRPQAKYDVVRSIAVDTLCKLWGVSLEQLDKDTARYLAPTGQEVRSRPRGSRRRRAADELVWRNLRTIRLQAG